MSDSCGDGIAIRLRGRCARIPPHAGAWYRGRFLRVLAVCVRHIAEECSMVSPPEE